MNKCFFTKNQLIVLVLALCLSNAVQSADISRPGVPSIELLEEVPADVVKSINPSVDENSGLRSGEVDAKKVSETLRPAVKSLTGSDPRPTEAKPQYLQSIQGMDSGVTITRVTPDESFGTHSYSRRQAWNADETKIDIKRKILDATNNYSVLLTHSLSSERIWSNIDPNLIYGLATAPKRNNFAKYDVATKTRTILRTFTEYDACTIGEYEGSISNNDRYVVLSCEDSSGGKDLISYDIEEDAVLGKIRADSDLNWVSFSQSGKFILVENNAPGNSLDEELVRYDKFFKGKEVLTDNRAHGDLGIDENGDDVFVMIFWDTISYIRLRDGLRVELSVTNRAGNGHVSCRAIRRPGWCYISSRDQQQRIAAVKISQNESVVELWGFSKATSSKYGNQPQASVSPSGEKVIFSSDWWSTLNTNGPHPGGGGNPNDYVLELVN